MNPGHHALRIIHCPAGLIQRRVFIPKPGNETKLGKFSFCTGDTETAQPNRDDTRAVGRKPPQLSRKGFGDNSNARMRGFSVKEKTKESDRPGAGSMKSTSKER